MVEEVQRIDELIFNLSGDSLDCSEIDYLELNFSRYINQIASPIVLHVKYFAGSINFQNHHRIDFIEKKLFHSFLKDIDVFKVDKIKDPFDNIKERIILKEKVLILDLEE